MHVGIFRLPKNPEFVHQNLGALNREGWGGLADMLVEKCMWPLDHHGIQWVGL
jgi:hypothetical protein